MGNITAKRNRVGMLCIVILGLGGFTLSASACSCVPPVDVSAAFDQAHEVFAGRVVALELVTILDADPTVSFAPEYLKVTLAVHSRWKGEDVEEAVVYTAFTCCICGFGFEIGEEYLIYASLDVEGRPQTSICDRTALLQGASEDLVILGDLEPMSLGDDAGSEGGVIQP